MSLWAIAAAKPNEFGFGLALPPGYTAGAAVVTKLKQPGTLQSFSTGRFSVLLSTGQTVQLLDTEFTVKPVNSQCAGLPPYPTIGSHSVCVGFKGAGFKWHCPWEFSYGLLKYWTTCNKATLSIDCNDADRITRVVNKYTWIGQRTDGFGPEMHCAACNTYAQACVKYICQAGPIPGIAPAVPTRLYDSQMPTEGATGSMGLMMAACVASVFAVTMMVVFVVVRMVKARAADREASLIDEELDGEDAVLNSLE